MIYLLTVIFFNLDGEPYTRDGWHPIEVPTIERCERGKARIEEHIDASIIDGGFRDISSYEVTCILKTLVSE
jgi:hypothetical protein